ncbi:hypothetical protein L1987_08944 [Smallanthus sonchifolius]|uniref:Uncharacterized protein n=1 Tax=Smallanthus sonchifolius TaxID=185202 RepID=A0ACB9JM03_9ASTR|nr:hypothetical protein L1987_08944 [Smallanthus sonchifolius]
MTNPKVIGAVTIEKGILNTFEPLKKSRSSFSTIKIERITRVEMLEGALRWVGTTISTITTIFPIVTIGGTISLSELSYELRKDGSDVGVGVGHGSTTRRHSTDFHKTGNDGIEVVGVSALERIDSMLAWKNCNQIGEFDVQQTQLETQHKLISQQQQDFKALSDIVELLKASLVKSSSQETPSTVQGETTSAGGHSSPAFVSNPESALTIFTGKVAKTKETMEVKIEETEFDFPSTSERRAARERGKGKESYIEVVILDEEEIGPDHELNALLDEIDNYGFNDEYPEIMATEDLHEEKVRYFTEEGDEIQALSDDDKDEASVKVDLVNTEPTTIEPIHTTHTDSLPRYDLRALAKLPLQNLGKVNEARNFETQKPWVSLRYKPTETVKSIIVPRSVPVQLQNFRKWLYNTTIGSVVIECEGKEDIHIFEPMELLKFQPEDLEVLFNNPIKLFHDNDEADAKAYQRVVTINAKPQFQKSSQDPTA